MSLSLNWARGAFRATDTVAQSLLHEGHLRHRILWNKLCLSPSLNHASGMFRATDTVAQFLLCEGHLILHFPGGIIQAFQRDNCYNP